MHPAGRFSTGLPLQTSSPTYRNSFLPVSRKCSIPSVSAYSPAPGAGSDSVDWEAPAPKCTLRELLSNRVRREADAFDADRPEIYHALVAPEESERILNGYRLKRLRELDPAREVNRALHAFETNGFMVFADGRQIESLDEEIDFAATRELEFIRLVPLVGG